MIARSTEKLDRRCQMPLLVCGTVASGSSNASVHSQLKTKHSNNTPLMNRRAQIALVNSDPVYGIIPCVCASCQPATVCMTPTLKKRVVCVAVAKRGTRAHHWTYDVAPAAWPDPLGVAGVSSDRRCQRKSGWVYREFCWRYSSDVYCVPERWWEWKCRIRLPPIGPCEWFLLDGSCDCMHGVYFPCPFFLSFKRITSQKFVIFLECSMRERSIE
jgi:hypothetical protein